MSRLNSPSDATPFLVPRAVQRTGDAFIPGYDPNELDVWVVDTAQGVLPIVECRQMSETLTKTHAIRCARGTHHQRSAVGTANRG